MNKRWEELKLRMISSLGRGVIHLIAGTVRVKTVGYDQFEELVKSGKGFIMAVWHGRTMIPVYYCRGKGIWAITSLSQDGEIQTRVVSGFGYRIIRGSSGRGGMKAALIAGKKLREGGILSITPDGPTGPTREVQEGIVFLAQRGGCPILPLGVGASPRGLMHTWDSYLAPLPFSKSVIVFGKPIYLNDPASESDGLDAKKAIKEALDDCQAQAEKLAGEGTQAGLPSIGYNLLLLTFSPVLTIWYLWRILITKKSNESWRGNLGAVPRLADRPSGQKLVWIHAASVGEVVSSLPVQEALRKLLPDCLIVITTVTQTGNSVARKSPYATAAGYLPLDYTKFVHRALDRIRPDVFISVEAELWPNMLTAAHSRGIPCVLINGRVSDRSMKRLRWWGWVMKWTVSNLDMCIMQTEMDAERIRIMGVRPEAITVAGNTKFDEDGEQLPQEAVDSLRSELGLSNGHRVMVAGSTNPGEEQIVLNAFQQIRRREGDLGLIIAPRQIDRAQEIRSMVERRGLTCALRSDADSQKQDWDVLVLNSFGELAKVYAVGELAFVGGSLIPKGGHSLIQPILQGKPVLFGPHIFKTRDVANTVISSGVGFQVSNAESLASCACELLAHKEVRDEIRDKCRGLVAKNQGASVRCAELIAGIIGVKAEN